MTKIYVSTGLYIENIDTLFKRLCIFLFIVYVGMFFFSDDGNLATASQRGCWVRLELPPPLPLMILTYNIQRVKGSGLDSHTYNGI